jgi:hypothetical protein
MSNIIDYIALCMEHMNTLFNFEVTMIKILINLEKSPGSK